MTDTAQLAPLASPDDVLAFWRKAGPEKWFNKDPAFDAEIVARFMPAYEAAVTGRLAAWEATAEGALALTIVLDQFPRNMFRNSPRAWVGDPVARGVAERAMARGFDAQVPADQRSFFYLPLMHSEELADQERCVALYQALGEANGIKYAEIHRDIIAKFGRFPHRNSLLGRTTTPEEQAFLDSGGFAG
jgi:uncharacterized protein (DUF924 family)